MAESIISFKATDTPTTAPTRNKMETANSILDYVRRNFGAIVDWGVLIGYVVLVILFIIWNANREKIEKEELKGNLDRFSDDDDDDDDDDDEEEEEFYYKYDYDGGGASASPIASPSANATASPSAGDDDNDDDSEESE